MKYILQKATKSKNENTSSSTSFEFEFLLNENNEVIIPHDTIELIMRMDKEDYEFINQMMFQTYISNDANIQRLKDLI